ncbi:hypothetical protein [Streptomyces sp. NPDC018059]|uniref:hypothetical protein n=1 Tax=Streptomyces sp. NPDC018059 TaxID=3365041 RepID=UPI003793F9FF
MAAPKNRSARIQNLVRDLSLKFGLEQHIRAEYDARRRSWSFEWTDGPTADQVRRAAKRIDKEAAAEIAQVHRHYTAQAQALGAIRMRLAGRKLPPYSPYGAELAVDEFLQQVPNPAVPKGEREKALLARLLDEATPTPEPDIGEQPRRTYPDGRKACELIAKKGIVWLLTPPESAGPQQAAVPLTPLEQLTVRYARGDAFAAWQDRLTPMPAAAAFAAVLADPDAPPSVTQAALDLLPELHAALDQGAQELRRRLD